MATQINLRDRSPSEQFSLIVATVQKVTTLPMTKKRGHALQKYGKNAISVFWKMNKFGNCNSVSIAAV
jgi:hypothetical protein